jgi:fatty aldehyde-generating acyl-ACP reductase
MLTQPSATRSPPWFSFIVHPRDQADIRRSSHGSLLWATTTGEEEFFARVNTTPPLVVGEITFGFEPPRGELVCVPRTPDQLATSEGRRLVSRAVATAAARGARVIGLGGLTAPLTAGGRGLLREMPAHTTLTNGNAYTAAVVRHNVIEAVSRARPSAIAVVGCTGSVGVAVSQLLADAGLDLVLIGRTADSARTRVGKVPCARYSGDLSDVSHCNVVVLLTNAAEVVLKPTLLNPGAIVVDVAQPPNVTSCERRALSASAIEVVAGGLVRIPKYRCSYDLNLPDPGETFACLAQTYVLAREGIREHSVGRPSADEALTVERWAIKQGIQPVPLAVRQARSADS